MVIQTSNQTSPNNFTAVRSPSDTDLETQSLDELKRKIVACQLELTELVIGTLYKAIELGLLLIQVRKRLPRGKFLDWINRELHPACGVKLRTAQRYMRLARNRELIFSRIDELASAGNTVESSVSLASQTIRRLKIVDGERLIAPRKATNIDVAEASPVLAAIEEVLRDFGHQATGVSELYRGVLPNQLDRIDQRGTSLFKVSEDRSNLAAVRRLCELRPPLADRISFLWIRGRRMEAWLPLLNAFPRLCISDSQAGPKRTGPQWWLFGLVTPPLFEPLANELSRFGDVLIPYPAAANPNLNTRLERE